MWGANGERREVRGKRPDARGKRQEARGKRGRGEEAKESKI
jgi:hypothetical protein